MNPKNNNTITLLVGKSGSGKTTIANTLKSFGYKQINSYTTRKPRIPNEEGHIFLTDAEFNQLTDLVGYTEYGGNRYCATSKQVDENNIYVIDPAGVTYFKEKYSGVKDVIVIYINSGTILRFIRMLKRGDTVLAAIKRLWIDHKKFRDVQAYVDFSIVNKHHLYSAVNTIDHIINLYNISQNKSEIQEVLSGLLR